MRSAIVSAFASVLTLAVAAPAYAGAPAAAAGAKWEIDSSHAAAQFAVKHLMVSTVRGQLGKVTGTVTTTGKDFAGAVVDVTVDIGGINTRDEKRDGHLKSPDFFDAAKFPSLTFKSKKVEKGAAAGKWKITGDLTMRGVTKELVLDAEVGPELNAWGATVIGATATGKLNRKDFGLAWNKVLEAGGVAVGEEVTILIDVELKKVGK